MKCLIFLVFSLNLFFIFKDNGKVLADDVEELECEEVTSATARLRHYLLCNYDQSVRPVKNLSSTTMVRIHMAVVYIDMMDYESKIAVHNWILLSWQDEHLTWNPDDYDGITEYPVHPSEIWKPDLSLFNGYDPASPDAFSNPICKVDQRGSVECISPEVYEGLCIPNYKNWPYNTQTCDLNIGSWSTTGEHINFKFRPSVGYSIHNYEENTEWELVTIKAVYHVGKYDCCPNQTFPTVQYFFTMKHHSTMYVAVLIVPAFVLLLMNVIATSLNPLSSARIPLLATNILCHVSYLQTMVDHIFASGSDCPNLILFYRDSLIITLIILSLSILIKSLHQWTISSPEWLTKITQILLGNKIGQIILLNTSDPKSVAAIIDCDDDQGNLVSNEDGNCGSNNSNPKQSSDWMILGIILDKILFYSIFVTYAILCVRLLPTAGK